MTDKLVRIVETLGGAAGASFAGAYAVKYGFHPDLVSYILMGAGAFSATRKREFVRALGLGATAAAGSQLLLLKLNPAPAALKATQIASPPTPHPVLPPPQPKQPTQPGKLMNADLGSLAPGMLDAAFERARAELAVAGEGYPAGYEPGPRHIHHGPVFPGG
jgi:hypothetical protein